MPEGYNPHLEQAMTKGHLDGPLKGVHKPRERLLTGSGEPFDPNLDVTVHEQVYNAAIDKLDQLVAKFVFTYNTTLKLQDRYQKNPGDQETKKEYQLMRADLVNQLKSGDILKAVDKARVCLTVLKDYSNFFKTNQQERSDEIVLAIVKDLGLGESSLMDRLDDLKTLGLNGATVRRLVEKIDLEIAHGEDLLSRVEALQLNNFKLPPYDLDLAASATEGLNTEDLNVGAAPIRIFPGPLKPKYKPKAPPQDGTIELDPVDATTDFIPRDVRLDRNSARPKGKKGTGNNADTSRII